MKYSKKMYRRLGTFFCMLAIILLIGSVLFFIMDAYYKEGQHWFIIPVGWVGAILLFTIGAVFHSKATNWYPLTISNKHLGYMQNVSIRLLTTEYGVSFDLVNQEGQMIKKQNHLRTRNKLLVDSFMEGCEISYSNMEEKKEAIWFPDLHSEVIDDSW